MLDWYINPDHAPIMVAEQIGAFKARAGRQDCPPSDPALPPRMVAARQADLAITYQPQVRFFADEGLPLVRVGTLINSPLNTVIAWISRSKPRQICKARRWATRSAELSRPPRRPWRNMRDRSGQHQTGERQFPADQRPAGRPVDAVIGGYRNIEAQELKLQGKTPVVMNVEDYGVPTYDELVIVAHRDAIHEAKIRKFLTALQAGVGLSARPSTEELGGVRRRPPRA